jgi:predicted secreted hydrolase
MRRLVVFAIAFVAVRAAAADQSWRIAEPGWTYQFPRDHHVHSDFKTEWWYFTGNLFDEGGKRFGYELTFFREGIRPPRERGETLSRFIVDDLKFAHFTVTDVTGKRFSFLQKTSRGSFGEAGFASDDRIAWIESWNLRLDASGRFEIAADSADASVRLQLIPENPPLVHGQEGISAKASGEGHASHYYSIARLTSRGELRVGNSTKAVRGESWFDHEWATNQLAPNQAGWNWLCVQFSDGSALMLYQMRLTNGGIDPVSSGTLIASDGSTTFVPGSAFDMVPGHFWKSTKSGANYPIGWRIRLPEQALDFTVTTPVEDQELALPPLTYWEGAIDAAGECRGKAITGRGYLELTGYAGALRGLSR